MKVQGLYNIEEDIKINDLKEVTSSVIYRSQNVYNPAGLFSEEIFGATPNERWYRCGYIKLPIRVFNPMVAKTIIARSGGALRKCAYGLARYDLIKGVLTESPDGQYSGMVDLYKIWNDIDIKKTLKTRSDDNIDILTKCSRDLIFINKLLVLPPNFRPIGMKNGRAVKSEINSIYMKILGYKSITARVTTTAAQVHNKLQDAIVELYTYIQKYLGTKNGFLQKNLLAKNTVGTVRNVISAPSYRSNNPVIGIYRTGYPMMSLVSMFHPFVKFQMKQFLSYDNIVSFDPSPDDIKRSDIDNIYDDRAMEELMRIFMQNPGSRFRILYADPENKRPITFSAMNLKTKEPITRELTLTDVIYLCCYNACVKGNKHVYTVRYPIGDYLGAFFTKIHVLSTNDTIPVQFMGETYQTYPIVDPQASHAVASTSFIDVLKMSNARLINLGGDYDGDTVKSTGIWSDEANAQAEKLMTSVVYNVRPDLTAAFPIEKECLNGLYGLTKME
jgi:hypothetical protein